MHLTRKRAELPQIDDFRITVSERDNGMPEAEYHMGCQ
jgi:hypothetical protein